MAGSTVLLIDCGEGDMDLLAARIQRLGVRTLRVKTPADAYMALSNGRLGIGAALLPPDAPVADLRSAIARLREVASEPALSMLVVGPKPGHSACADLRAAGIDYALYDPMDAHTLRFQLNRATAWRHSSKNRRADRAPFSWTVRMRSGRRAKAGRVYTVSPRGLFVTVPAPWLRGTEVKLELELQEGRKLRLAGHVAVTNVKGNLMKTALPVGMGIQIDRLSNDAEARLAVAVQERLRRIAVSR